MPFESARVAELNHSPLRWESPASVESALLSVLASPCLDVCGGMVVAVAVAVETEEEQELVLVDGYPGV